MRVGILLLPKGIHQAYSEYMGFCQQLKDVLLK